MPGLPFVVVRLLALRQKPLCERLCRRGTRCRSVLRTSFKHLAEVLYPEFIRIGLSELFGHGGKGISPALGTLAIEHVLAVFKPQADFLEIVELKIEVELGAS